MTDYCIENRILADFLAKNRAEAIAVCIFEYDEEKHMRHEREIWESKGHEEGRKNEAREAAKKMIMDNEIPLEKIAHYLPSISIEELKEIEAEITQLK